MAGQSWELWAGFTLFILLVLALDLGLFQRRPHVISTREALAWFAAWTTLALLFNLGIALFHERHGQAALEFFTGFVVEKSLSVDNVFVFILIFGYFQVPPAYQHKVLFWGILGAIALRVAFIIGGLALLERFAWTAYLFGAFLVATGILMLRRREHAYDPDRNPVIRAARRIVPVTEHYERNRFFVRRNGRLWATPLFIVLLAIESSDIIFAADSIPAIFAITTDPFIVYTSNIFAMLGLRSLYFAVAGFMQMFHFLRYGFASIILILGIKMLLSDVYHLPVEVSLMVILMILALCVIVSLLWPRPADMKRLLARTERLGLIPFRRLLLIENIIDLGDLRVRDAMRPRAAVQVIALDRPWEEHLELMRRARFSRYPLVEREGEPPCGILHVKQLLTAQDGRAAPELLRRLARPPVTMTEELALEEALARFTGRYDQMALVVDGAGQWTGIITAEDVLEELVGRIGDEFDQGRGGEPVVVADALSPGRVILDLHAESLTDAVREIVDRVPRTEWPADPPAIRRAVLEREALMSTYLGHGLAVPHARIDGIERPVAAFARSETGIPLPDSDERADLLFLLLTPSRMARIQPRLLADIVGLLDSEFVTERLRRAASPEDVIDAIRAGQQVVLD